MSSEPIKLPLHDARALVAKALTENDVSAKNAASVAKALVDAEIDGQSGHGFARVAAYAAQARSGKVDGHAEPEADADPDPDPDGEALSAMIRIDARRGFAFPAIDLAIDLLARRAVDTKLAGAAIRRSHHCGQLGAHVERLAERGLVALMAANAPKAIAPWGGARPFFGTNPIAFAAPIDDAPPLVIDLSISKVARGKVMAAAKAGEAIPEGWALDPTGAPTTDPNAALAGTMAPLGDAKGAALALMVEVLAATLTGANQSYQSSSFFDADGPPPGVGQLILAFDPAGALGGPGFGARMSALLAAMTAEEGVRPPGARRHAARERALREGVAISPRLKAEIDAISGGA